MSLKKWRGDAPAIPQVSTSVITAYDTATTYAVTMNGKSISVPGQGGTTATTGTQLLAGLTASLIPEFKKVAWALVGSTIIGTSTTPGVPFTCTSSATGGSGTMGAFSNSAGSGPNDIGLAANYIGGLPVNGDDLVFENSNVSALWNLAALSGVALNSLTFKASYTGTVGLPECNAAGYQEYFTTKFTIGAATVTIGDGSGGVSTGGLGSGRIKLNTGSGGCNLNLHSSAPTAEPGTAAVYWMGTGTNNITISRGTLDIAMYAGDSATVATLRCGYQANPLTDSYVRVGAAVTLATVAKSGGTAELYSGCTALTNSGGSTYLYSGNVTTINGSVRPSITSIVSVIGGITITTLNVVGGAVTFNQDQRPAVVTNANVYGGSLIDSAGRVTWSNPVALYAPPGLATVDLGPNASSLVPAVTF